MIIKLDNPLMIPKLVKMAEAVPGTPLDKLRKFMFDTINRPNTKAYVDIHDEEIRGFIYATLEQFEGEPCVWVQFCVVKPCEENKYICFELLTKIKLWAKEKGINNLYFSTKRDPDAWARKYHFQFHSSILKLDLTKE